MEILTNDNNASSLETNMEINILDFIQNTSFTLANLLQSANIDINDSDTLILEDINLKVLIGMYCSPGLEFAPKPFKDDLKECSVKTINTIKIYKALQDLSKDASDYYKTRSATFIVPDEPIKFPEDGTGELEDPMTPLNISVDLVNITGKTPDKEGLQLEGEDFLGYIVRTEKQYSSDDFFAKSHV
jgi:hypothetical protein